MTLKIQTAAVLLATVMMMASCLKSDEESKTYDDVAITAVSLGTVVCNRNATPYSYSASSFAIYIDQINDRIFNFDSLVVKTQLTNVPVTFTTLNNGVVAVKNLDNDEFVVGLDSINFTQERTVRVFSSDGTHSRDYRMSIVAHQEYGDSYTWTRLPDCSFAANYTALTSANLNGKLFLLGKTATGYELLSSADGNAWQKHSPTQLATATSASLVAYNGKLFALADGALYTSTDADTWTAVTVSGTTLKTLIGGYRSQMYALAVDNSLVMSSNEGVAWTVEDTKSSQYVDYSSYMPATELNFVGEASKVNGEVNTATIVGLSANDAYAYPVVWNKLVDPGKAQPWIYTAMSGENSDYKMPKMEHLSVIGYADGMLAVGGNSPDKLYFSPDHGVTWHPNDGVTLPEGFTAVNGATLLADNSGCFILVATGSATVPAQVWRGRQNKRTWKNQQTYFE